MTNGSFDDELGALRADVGQRGCTVGVRDTMGAVASGAVGSCCLLWGKRVTVVVSRTAYSFLFSRALRRSNSCAYHRKGVYRVAGWEGSSSFDRVSEDRKTNGRWTSVAYNVKKNNEVKHPPPPGAPDWYSRVYPSTTLTARLPLETGNELAGAALATYIQIFPPHTPG